jgi:hypothetical protein
MMDDLQKAYAAYQQALNNLPNPKVVTFVIIISFEFHFFPPDMFLFNSHFPSLFNF